jgi:hypothetical protein
MQEARRTWPALVVRGIALWILAGAAFKLLLGTAADLPRFLREAPLDIRWTYRLVIAVETFVALFALARPRRAWPLVALLLLVFVGGLVALAIEGAPSCGCFGAKLPIPPIVMLGIDLTLFVLLMVAAPWRLPPARSSVDLGSAAVALALAVVATVALDREGHAIGSLRPQEYVDVERWVGRPVEETPLARWADLSQVVDGQWFLYSETCEVCAECLWQFAAADGRMKDPEGKNLELTLVRVPQESSPDDKPKVHAIPEGPDVHTVEPSTRPQWIFVPSPPAEMEVREGRIVRARAGFGIQECRWDK